MKGDEIWIWKEAVLLYVMVLPGHSSIQIEENHEKPHDRW
jgi:hypothetical protein